MPSNKLGYYDGLVEQGLDINPTGNLSPKNWTDDLLDIVLDRESKTLIKETAENATVGMVETATKGGLRNTLKGLSPALFDGFIEGTFNAYDYLWGEKKNETDKFQKWMVSSGVDTIGSLATGGIAALTVAGILYLVGASITVPATLAVAFVIAAGAIFDGLLEATGWKETIKKGINSYIDSAQALPQPYPAQPAIPVATPSIDLNPTSTPVPSSISSTPPSPITAATPSASTPSPTPNQTPEP